VKLQLDDTPVGTLKVRGKRSATLFAQAQSNSRLFLGRMLCFPALAGLLVVLGGVASGVESESSKLPLGAIRSVDGHVIVNSGGCVINLTQLALSNY
jgi:hypothetical protein